MTKLNRRPKKLIRAPHNSRDFTKREIVAALKSADGYVTKAARILQTNFTTLKKWITRFNLYEEQQQYEEELLDLSEDELKKRIKAGDLKAIMFCLKCKGKDRGWIEEVPQSLLPSHTPVTFKYEVVTRNNITINNEANILNNSAPIEEVRALGETADAEPIEEVTPCQPPPDNDTRDVTQKPVKQFIIYSDTEPDGLWEKC